MVMREACDRHNDTTKDVRPVFIQIMRDADDDTGEPLLVTDAKLGPRARKLLVNRVKALIQPPVKGESDGGKGDE